MTNALEVLPERCSLGWRPVYESYLQEVVDIADRYGMDVVSRDAFFAVMNPLNVHPRVVTSWREPIGFVSEWRTQSIGLNLVGVSVSGSYPMPKRYLLPPTKEE